MKNQVSSWYYRISKFVNEENLCLSCWPKWFIPQQSEMDFDIEEYESGKLQEGLEADIFSLIHESYVEEIAFEKTFTYGIYKPDIIKEKGTGRKMYLCNVSVSEESMRYHNKEGSVRKRRSRWNHLFRNPQKRHYGLRPKPDKSLERWRDEIHARYSPKIKELFGDIFVIEEQISEFVLKFRSHDFLDRRIVEIEKEISKLEEERDSILSNTPFYVRYRGKSRESREHDTIRYGKADRVKNKSIELDSFYEYYDDYDLFYDYQDDSQIRLGSLTDGIYIPGESLHVHGFDHELVTGEIEYEDDFIASIEKDDLGISELFAEFEVEENLTTSKALPNMQESESIRDSGTARALYFVDWDFHMDNDLENSFAEGFGNVKDPNFRSIKGGHKTTPYYKEKTRRYYY